jgi:hypothetical protein
VAELVGRLRQGNGFALVEVKQLQHDAEIAGLGDRMRAVLAPKLAREQFIHSMFSARGIGERLTLIAASHNVKLGLRIRMLLYSTFPGVYAPTLWIKRLRRAR